MKRQTNSLKFGFDKDKTQEKQTFTTLYSKSKKFVPGAGSYKWESGLDSYVTRPMMKKRIWNLLEFKFIEALNMNLY